MFKSRRSVLGPVVAVGALAMAVAGASPAFAGTVPTGPSARIAPHATCTPTSTLAGDHYSAVQIAQVAQQGGFTGNDWTISVAISEAESSGWTQATLVDSDCSVDRGLWQINSYWHSEVSDACAFDPSCAAQAAHTIWANGGWTQWSTYNNGAYQAYMSEAQAAVDQVSGGSGNGGGGGTCSAAAWSASAVYTAGDVVSYNGHTYTAKWWTQGNEPDVNTGDGLPWTDDGPC